MALIWRDATICIPGSRADAQKRASLASAALRGLSPSASDEMSDDLFGDILEAFEDDQAAQAPAASRAPAASTAPPAAALQPGGAAAPPTRPPAPAVGQPAATAVAQVQPMRPAGPGPGAFAQAPRPGMAGMPAGATQPAGVAAQSPAVAAAHAQAQHRGGAAVGVASAPPSASQPEVPPEYERKWKTQFHQIMEHLLRQDYVKVRGPGLGARRCGLSIS